MISSEEFLPSFRVGFDTAFPGGFPGGSDGKESACNARDLGSIPGLGRFPGGGNGNPLQDSCLKKPITQRFEVQNGKNNSNYKSKRRSR